MLSVTRKKAPIAFTYTIYNRPVRRVQSMKDLGVSVTSDLSWNSHINRLVSKCNRMMGMIKRSVGYKVPIKLFLICIVHLFAVTLNTVLQSGLHLISMKCKHYNPFNEQLRAILHCPDVKYSAALSPCKRQWEMYHT